MNNQGRSRLYWARPANCRRCHSYTPEACNAPCPDVVLRQWIMNAVAEQRDRMGRVMTDLALQDETLGFVKALAMRDLGPRWDRGE